ncbi:neural cell adhesion molecule 2 isoform X3 [Pseudomyrmex gracilis]|uniref:neural cell adhesion molecule 2 isoform X3 n=1 Tax=Pseudomyrmex gracilis TaxID=219809 RepID=UPI0009950450|nr:neural cell adhesion molecule 2 isoform X3 [Pseudomyrmex gracilis]
MPKYRYTDARNGSIAGAIHWAVSDDLGRRTYFQVGDGHRAKLKVTKVTLNDQGIFRCRVDFVNSPTRNFRVNLTLVEQPSKPVIYDAQGREVTGVGGPFLEGYEVALTCQVAGGRPRPSVTWWKDGDLLDGVVDTSPTVSNRFTLNYLYIHQVTKALWGAKLECRAQSGPMGKPIVREVPLDIYLKPAIVKITLSKDQIFAGRPIAAKCETWGSSPAAKIVWKLGEHKIEDPNVVSTTQRANSTVSNLALAFNKDDDGKELICRAENPRFPGGVLEEIKVLSVSYAPVVVARLATGYVLDTLREGDDLKLICDVQSHPPSSRVIWYHNNQRLEHNVSAGILLASNSLTFRMLTLKHTGEYSCMATNAVGETHSAPLFIHMKYAPRCKEGKDKREITVARHEKLLLECEVEALPDDYVRFSWTYNGSIGDVLPIPNSRIESKGLVSVLEYSPSADFDYGTLACWASNSIGRQRSPCIFNIIPAKPPQSPLDCSLYNESSSLEVNCIPGSDGGSPQHFVLEVRGFLRNSGIDTLQTPQNDQGLVGESSPIYQDMSPTPNFQLHDLEPGYDYTVYVYAVNGRGWSEPALLEHVRIANSVGFRKKLEKNGIFLEDLKKALPQASSENMIIAIALTGIGAVALVLVGIGVIIGVAACRKRSNTPILDGPDDFTTPTYIPAQRVEPRVRYSNENRRSQRASLYVEENRNEPDLLHQVELDMRD